MTTTVFNSKVRTVLRGSYSHHYRRLLPDLLAALEFRANNTTHRPVMDAVELLQRYKDIPVSDRPYYSRLDRVPLNGVVPREWRDAVLDDTDRVERIPYELCVLKALREAIRRREIWVVGANRWRNPDDDLPADFEDNRDVHYAALRTPLGWRGVRRGPQTAAGVRAHLVRHRTYSGSSCCPATRHCPQPSCTGRRPGRSTPGRRWRRCCRTGQSTET